MATRTITVDDISGTETLTSRQYKVTFEPLTDKDTLETVERTMDLGADSAKALWRFLSEGDTRDLAGLWPRRVRVGQTGDNGENAVIRAWAKQQPEFKNTIKDRGALPEDVVDAYRKAHPTTPAS
jgi:hypothetical protein